MNLTQLTSVGLFALKSRLRRASLIVVLTALSGFACFGQSGSTSIEATLVKLQFKDPAKPVIGEVIGEVALKSVLIDLRKLDLVKSEARGLSFALAVDVKIEQFQWQHEKGDIVRLRVDRPSNSSLAVTGVAIDSDGKVLSLIDPEESRDSAAIRTENETVRYVIAVMYRGFELSFSEACPSAEERNN